MTHVEQGIDGQEYTVAVHLADTTITLSPDTANALAYDLTEAALEPARCFDPECSNYAAPGEDTCAQHIADADETPDYADWRQA
jgi:hypothetical protein